MKVAVVGAGLAGLALTWHLKQKGYDVTLFDKEGIGCGASKACVGLMHPYVGEKGLRSFEAKEAIASTEKLLNVAGVTPDRGVIRFLTAEQIPLFQKYEDVEFLAQDKVLITSGMTIDVASYLQGLFVACKVPFIKGELTGEFDHVFLAMGAGMKNLGLNLKFLKGQRVRCKYKLEKSLLKKGYVAAKGDFVEIGSTYEKNFSSEDPDPGVWSILKEKVEDFFPEVHTLSVLECYAGVRVMNASHYLPIAKKLSDKLSVFTGLGSRGLLYHSYFAEKML